MYASKRSFALSLVLLLCAGSAFPQSGIAASDPADQPGEQTTPLTHATQIPTPPTSPMFDYLAENAASAAQGARGRQQLDLYAPEFHPQFAAGIPMAIGIDLGSSPTEVGLSFDAWATSKATAGDGPATDAPSEPREGSKDPPSIEPTQVIRPVDYNRDIYYRNKLEFSLDAGWHPINIPFPLDIFVGDVYNTYPLKYTLVPVFASLRWQVDGLEGPWVLRGNWDFTFTGSVTAIPRGPESHYLSYLMGIRRNFVPHHWKTAPYFDVRLGVGRIDAKGPFGVKYAQGQDVTFTINMGSGVRYNFSPRYALSAGLNFMHISNLDLSESNGKPNWGVRNYGINVYGPMVGIDIQLRRHPRAAE